MIKKLIELLPVSRRKYTRAIEDIMLVLDGLVEAEANHAQIETNLVQQLQAIVLQLPQKGKAKTQKSEGTKNGSDPAFQ